MLRVKFAVLVLLVGFWAGQMARAEEGQGVRDAKMEAGSVRAASKAAHSGNAAMWRWRQELMPLKVCVRDGSRVPGYEGRFREIFIGALNDWCKASRGKVRVQLVDTEQDANVRCLWVPDLRLQKERIGAECNWLFNRDGICLALVTLGVPWKTGPKLSDEMFKRVSLQAIGLALGLDYSDCAEDVMSDEFAKRGKESVLSQNDKKALRQLYSE